MRHGCLDKPERHCCVQRKPDIVGVSFECSGGGQSQAYGLFVAWKSDSIGTPAGLARLNATVPVKHIAAPAGTRHRHRLSPMGRTLPPSQFCAAGPSGVRDLIIGEIRPAVVLGAFPTAMYLRLVGGEVMALLTRDAVQLPLGLRLSIHSADHPLNQWVGPVRVGSNQLQTGDWSVRMSRLVSVRAPMGLEPNFRAIEDATRNLRRLGPAEPEPGVLDILLSDQRARAPAAVVGRLLGAGPGLTPTGDDVLAGFLVGAWSFGLANDPLRTAVLEAAPSGTTDLSAALLRCASRGESIPQVSALLASLSEGNARSRWPDDALTKLGRVGHTSGAALASGVIAAANVAARARSDQAAV